MFGVLGLISIIRIPMITFFGILKLSHLYNSLLILPLFFLAMYLGKKCT